jgi:multimeric flavodoxin WrbA
MGDAIIFGLPTVHGNHANESRLFLSRICRYTPASLLARMLIRKWLKDKGFRRRAEPRQRPDDGCHLISLSGR